MKSLSRKPNFAAYLKVSAIAGVAAAPLTANANFSGDYAVTPPAAGNYVDANANGTFGTWTGAWNGFGTVNLDTSLAPSQISIGIGSLGDFFNPDYTFLVKAAASGLVSFDYSTSFTGFGTAAFIDQTTSSSTPLTGSGTFMLTVNAGDLFGFEIAPSYTTTSALTLSNFSGPEPLLPPPSTGVPDEGSTLTLLAFGFVGLLAYRATSRRCAVIGA